MRLMPAVQASTKQSVGGPSAVLLLVGHTAASLCMPGCSKAKANKHQIGDTVGAGRR